MLTQGIAILLACGLAAAKLCQKLRLPSVTGYIVAGLLLGPTGFHIISQENVGHNLDHFTQIALMLIAFGIGEHIEIKKLKKHAKSLLWIGICETTGSFILVSLSIYTTIVLSHFQVQGWEALDYFSLSILLGAISVATAPAATLLVIRELRARGSLTSSLMAIIAIDNGLAIMLFGLAASVTQQLLGHLGEPLSVALILSIFEIIQSLVLGIVTGYVLRFIVARLRKNSEIMTAGLAVLLICGELAISFNLSPLLAGMTAGFILINKADRDVRTFRALNYFEPPIYILFFTLAGTHLDVGTLGSAGIISLVYFFARISSKIAGTGIGAKISNADENVKRYLGFALVPQAGVAIGLLFLVSSNEALRSYASIITPVVLTGVFLSELIGPLCARFAVTSAGEANAKTEKDRGKNTRQDAFLRSEEGVEIMPWTWNKLIPSSSCNGVVVFGAANSHTVRGLARMATILAHYYKAIPMSVKVDNGVAQLSEKAFTREISETKKMGYPLKTEHIPDKNIASGLVAAVEYHNARAVVMGFPVNGNTSTFQKILENVIENVLCPVIVIRFFGQLHTERILVPVTDMDDLAEVYPIICALAQVREQKVQVLYMMSSTAREKEIKQKEREINRWLDGQDEKINIQIKAVPTDFRVEVIRNEADEYDLVVIGASRTRGVSRFFFGSLADAVAEELRKPMIIVYNR